MVDYANVKLWGHTVGVVFWDAPRQTASFEYTPRFVQNGLQVSPFRMPLEAGKVYFFPELNFETYKGQNTSMPPAPPARPSPPKLPPLTGRLTAWFTTSTA